MKAIYLISPEYVMQIKSFLALIKIDLHDVIREYADAVIMNYINDEFIIDALRASGINPGNRLTISEGGKSVKQVPTLDLGGVVIVIATRNLLLRNYRPGPAGPMDDISLSKLKI